MRATINDEFWNLAFGERRLWFDIHIDLLDVKGREGCTITYKRKLSLRYHLPIDESKDTVCKTMFLHTLGLKTDAMVTEFVKSKTTSTLTETIADGRGKAPAKNKTDTQSIRDHILSYNPQVSHYRIIDAPNKRYLEPHLSVKIMWTDYASQNNVSYPVYHRVFQSENISFAKSSQDDCDFCAKYEMHKKDAPDDHDADSCTECLNGKKHLDRAGKARAEYRKDSCCFDYDPNVGIYAADMQKVILLPKMTLKEHFFISRLVVFNETFACLTPGKDILLLWHEAISGRNAKDVASSYIRCINLSGKNSLVFWADNCTSQNKKWTLFTALAWCVNQEWGPRTVEMRYLERGHTFMRADSIHGSIAKKMKKSPNIYDFEGFVDICDSAAQSTKPVAMKHDDFYLFESNQRSRQSKHVKLPHLNDMCAVKFEKGSRNLQFKSDFSQQEWTDLDFLRPKVDVKKEPAKLDQPRGISLKKKEGIMKLLEAFPGSKKKFWLDLPINDTSADLVHNFD